MSQRTSHVVFEGDRVAVSSACPEVHAGVRHAFRAMLGCPTGCPTGREAGRLEVYAKDGSFHLRGNEGAYPRSGSLREVLRCIQYEVTYRFIRARPDLLWVHAGAVSRYGRAIVVAGPWGCGKSTLVAQLCERGWLYLSDDVAPIEPHSGRVLSFPRTPMVRVSSEHALEREHVSSLEKRRVPLEPEEICWESVPVEALVFPSYSPEGAEQVRACTPGSAVIELLRQGLNGKDLQGRAVGYACELVERLPAFSLSYFDGARAADQLIAALADHYREAG